MLEIIYQHKFKKDLKKMKKQGRSLSKFSQVLYKLANEKRLSSENRNHKLKGNYVGCWECHITSDWLLIYEKTTTRLVLVRTGSHSDLF